MYLLKAIAAMLSIFSMVYVILSLIVVACWRRAAGAYTGRPAAAFASFLYRLRLAPLAIALSAAVLFELPAFLRFEPKHANEELGWAAVVSVAFCLALAIVVTVRAFGAWLRSEALLRRWEVHRSVAEGQGLAIYEAREPAPLVAVSGFLSSRILVSASARELLSERELRLAFAHEAAHADRHDNLRRFLFLLCAFPGMKSLEGAWSRAAEFAADDAAVTNRRDALDLAAALVKISRASVDSAGSHPLVANFGGSAGGTVERTERLMNWAPPSANGRRVPAHVLIAAFSAMVVIGCSYPMLLRGLHVLTESLFR